MLITEVLLSHIWKPLPNLGKPIDKKYIPTNRMFLPLLTLVCFLFKQTITELQNALKREEKRIETLEICQTQHASV